MLLLFNYLEFFTPANTKSLLTLRDTFDIFQ